MSDINKLDHVGITNVKEYNKVNDVIDNELKFDSNYSLVNSLIKDSQPITTIIIGGVKKSE